MKKLPAAACAVLVAAGGLGLVDAPARAITWPTPPVLSELTGDNVAPQVAVAPDGTATAVWIDPDGAFERIQASTRPPGGPWAPPTTISQNGEIATGLPQVAVAPDGTATAMWQRDGVSEVRVEYSTRPPGGVWSLPSEMPPGGFSEEAPQLVVAPDGTTTAAWSRAVASGYEVVVSTRPQGGVFSAPVTMSTVGRIGRSPQVTLGSNGSIGLVWIETDTAPNPDVLRVRAAVRGPAGAWSAALSANVSDGLTDVFRPQITVAPDGSATATWSADTIPGRVVSSTRPAAGAWALPVTLSNAAQDSYASQLVTLSNGTTVAVWSSAFEVGKYRVFTAARPSGGAWPVGTPLSPEGRESAFPQLALAPDGLTAVAVWTGTDGTNRRVHATTRSAAGTWGTTDYVSTAGTPSESPQLAIGASGTTAIIWEQGLGDLLVHASVLEAAFPVVPLAPETSAISGKKTIKKASAKYSFTSLTPGATFQCRVDKKFKKYVGVSPKKAKKQVPWKACTSPYAVKAKKLQNGKHKVFVRAVLGTQVDPTPSVKKIKVKR